MKKLHVYFMKDLRNHAFVELYNIITSYIDKQAPADANIKAAFEMVISQKEKLSDMQKRKPSVFSRENKKLTHSRNDYLISLRLRVQSYLLSPISTERDAAQEIQSLIEPYGREYYVPTIRRQTIFSDDLKNQLKKKDSLKKAVSFLGLSSLINTVIEMTHEIMNNYNERITENGKTKSKRKGVKEEAYYCMKVMADTINLVATVNKHNTEKRIAIDDYIYYIGGILQDFRTQLKSRNTKRSNTREEETTLQNQINIQSKDPKQLVTATTDSVDNSVVPSANSELTDTDNSTITDKLREDTSFLDSQEGVSSD